jgi:hypothetical protein
VVIRTASDAYEFTVGSDGDIVKAITQGTPLITPLPNEEHGTAISYSADGTQLLTLSTTPKPILRSYRPFRPAPATADPAANAAPVDNSGQNLFRRLVSTHRSQVMIAGGVIGLVIVIAGVLLVRRARRRRDDDYDDEDQYDYGYSDRQRRRSSRDPYDRTGQRPHRSLPPDRFYEPDPYNGGYDHGQYEPYADNAYSGESHDWGGGRVYEQPRWSGDDYDPWAGPRR